jgi:hypothetical protein
VTRNRPAEVRYSVDADLLGLARVLTTLRPDVTYPVDPGGTLHRRERPPCPITSPDVADLQWIPDVARRGWLILTRDGQIQAHQQELAAVRDHGARMIALNTEHARGTFNQLETVMCQWRKIQDLQRQPGPFIYIASRSALRPVPLT